MWGFRFARFAPAVASVAPLGLVSAQLAAPPQPKLLGTRQSHPQRTPFFSCVLCADDGPADSARVTAEDIFDKWRNNAVTRATIASKEKGWLQLLSGGLGCSFCMDPLLLPRTSWHLAKGNERWLKGTWQPGKTAPQARTFETHAKSECHKIALSKARGSNLRALLQIGSPGQKIQAYCLLLERLAPLRQPMTVRRTAWIRSWARGHRHGRRSRLLRRMGVL